MEVARVSPELCRPHPKAELQPQDLGGGPPAVQGMELGGGAVKRDGALLSQRRRLTLPACLLSARNVLTFGQRDDQALPITKSRAGQAAR